MPRPLPLFICLLALPLAAQSPALETTADEVVVTGSKTVRARAESPVAVTVIDSATIARAGDLAQLLDQQAGLVINGAYANFGKDRSLFQRNGPNAFTLILLDGQPLLDPSALDGAVDLRLLSLAGIERIEILRGPQALLYGADAVAGVINLISREPESDATPPAKTPPLGAGGPPALHLRASAMTYDTYEGAASISRRGRRFDYQLGYEHFTTAGISEARPEPGSTADFDRDGATRRTLTAALAFRPITGLSIRPSLRLASFDGDFDTGSFQDGNNRYENEAATGIIAADYQTGNTHLGASYVRTLTSRDFRFGDPGFTSAFRGRSAQAEVFGTKDLKRAGRLTAGVQLRREAIDDRLPDTLRTALTVAPYVQYTRRLADRFLVDAGLRYNIHDAFGGQLNYSLAAAADLSKEFVVRLSLASAFQSPTLDQLYGLFGANPDLAPQTSRSLEAGGEWRPGQGSRLGLTFFARAVDDIIVFTDVYRNAGELTDVGVELTGSGRLGERFGLDGYLSYVRGRLNSVDFLGQPTETEDFFRRPRTTGRLSLTYDAPFPLTARLTASYVGDRPDILFDPNFVPIFIDLDSYFLLHAYAEYRFGEAENLRLFVDVNNLTDTDFVEVSGFGILGRTLRVGASAALGR